MFDPTSRYFDIPTAQHTQPDGRTVAYVRRRFLPPASGMTVIGQIQVQQGDRLDLLAHRAFSDAESGWRIADSNDALYPPDLITPGRRLLLAMPLP
jgi:hypothetical protein